VAAALSWDYPTTPRTVALTTEKMLLEKLRELALQKLDLPMLARKG
jgi:hypothetical protein